MAELAANREWQIMRPLSIILHLLSLSLAASASGQTFRGTVVDRALFSFASAPAGQYDVTLTWDDSRDSLSLALVCDNDQGDPVTYGVSSGDRDRAAHLSVGIVGERPCVMGLLVTAGMTPQYTLNFAATTTTVVAKTSREPVAERALAALEEIGLRVRSMRENARLRSSSSRKALGPTRTFLEQIRGGRARTFTLGVEGEGFVQISSMWNRKDTDLRLTMVCSDGETSIPWGVSESGQERALRFDADVVTGSTCEVTLESPSPMVYAVNFAFLGDGGLTRF